MKVAEYISSLLLSVEVMVHGRKSAKETLLPSVLEDDDAETQSEKLQLGGEVGRRASGQVCKHRETQV